MKAGSSQSLWAPRPEQTPPHQPYPAKYTPLVLSFGGFSTSRAGEAELGQQHRVCSGLAALAVVPLLGLLVAASRDAKIDSEQYKTSATPSSGLAETPSGGCGKDGFFLRLSLKLQKQLCGGTPFLRRRGESSRILWMGLLRVAGGVIGAAPEHRYMQRSLVFSVLGVWIRSTLKKSFTTSTPPLNAA